MAKHKAEKHLKFVFTDTRKALNIQCYTRVGEQDKKN